MNEYEEINIEGYANTFAQIPMKLLLDSTITPMARLSYGLIASLANMSGVCWASNSYLAKLLNLSIVQISRSVNQLKEAGYISVELIRKDNKIVRRNIYTEIKIGKKSNEESVKNDNIIKNDTNIIIKSDKKCIIKNDKEKYINNKYINLNNIYTPTENEEQITPSETKPKRQKKEFVPPTLEEVEAYCKERKNNVNAKIFFDYYNDYGWKDNQGRQVKDWKRKLVFVWEKKADNVQTPRMYERKGMVGRNSLLDDTYRPEDSVDF